MLSANARNVEGGGFGAGGWKGPALAGNSPPSLEGPGEERDANGTWTVSDKNKPHVLEPGGKGIFNNVAENLAELCSVGRK